MELRGLRLRPVREGAEDRVDLDLGAARSSTVAALLESLRALDGVRVAEYTRAAPRPATAEGVEGELAGEEGGE